MKKIASQFYKNNNNNLLHQYYLENKDNIITFGVDNESNYMAYDINTNEVKFTINENNFENRYITPNGSFGTLNNQLILRLKGYKVENGELKQHTYNIDVNEQNYSSFTINNLYISNDAIENSTTHQDWDINLILRNYRDYNQSNNADKKIIEDVDFKITSCERRR